MLLRRFARSFGEFRGDLGRIPGAKEPRPTLLEGGSAEYLRPPGRRTDSLARHLWHGSLGGAGFKGLRPVPPTPHLSQDRLGGFWGCPGEVLGRSWGGPGGVLGGPGGSWGGPGGVLGGLEGS